MRNRVLILTLVIAMGCGNQPTIKQPSSRPVKSTVAVVAGYLDKEFVGLSTPDRAVNLAFKLSGQLLQIPVAKGDEVSRGELLAQIDPRDIELQVAADLSAYEQSKSKLNRIKRLLSREAVSRQEFEMAEAEYARAKSTYENSRELLVQCELRAPFDAVVERVNIDEYQRVAAGEAVMRIVSPTSTSVEFTIPESSLRSLMDSTTYFTVEFDDHPGVIFEAKIKEYARTSSDASGLPVALTITNHDPRRYTILSGMSAVINMYSTIPDDSAVTLPLSSIYAPAGGGEYVWVITPQDIVERRAVMLEGVVGRNSVIVSSGVKAGERVVSAGLYQIKEGEKVKILK